MPRDTRYLLAVVECRDGRTVAHAEPLTFTTARGRRRAMRDAERRTMRAVHGWWRITWHCADIYRAGNLGRAMECHRLGAWMVAQRGRK